MANIVEINRQKVGVGQVAQVFGEMVAKPRENVEQGYYEFDMGWLPFDVTVLRFGQNGEGVWWELDDGVGEGQSNVIPTEQLANYFLGPLLDEEFEKINGFEVEIKDGGVALRKNGVQVEFVT